MVQSAMMFALGVFVSGLAWLALVTALVRRTRRLTQRRLLARIATRRAEFEAERDELRARHAVELHRVEREASRVLDMATAHRLESDVKDRDLRNLRAELAARGEEIAETQQRLTAQYEALQDLERRHAEASSALRTTQHLLQQETSRRTAAEESLDELEAMAAQRRVELSALRAENEALRATLAGRIAPEAGDIALPMLPARTPPPAQAEVPEASSGSVVPLPTRARPAAAPEPPAPTAEAARQLQRLTGEAHGDFGRTVWRAPARAEPRMPHASHIGEPSQSAVAAASQNGPTAAGSDAAPDREANPETRFFEALAEIRALKRAASQAGE